MTSAKYDEVHSIPLRLCGVLEAARCSITTITPKANPKNVARLLLKEYYTTEMADTLDDLTAQENSRMNMESPGDGFTIVGQLSSILRTDMDFLLTTLNLKCWSFLWTRPVCCVAPTNPHFTYPKRPSLGPTSVS